MQNNKAQKWWDSYMERIRLGRPELADGFVVCDSCLRRTVLCEGCMANKDLAESREIAMVTDKKEQKCQQKPKE